ncbi:hypothetical protein IKG64_01490, partial [Candidatus Saccharibacteria bacterium]|nr:hypothetical protein [Candidatus Saccharibacteria bacterium]
KETLVFNKYNHLLAADCTPEDYKIEVEVTKITDPMTGSDVYNVPEPYNRDTSDTCDYSPPQVSLSLNGTSLVAAVRRGSSDITGYTLYVNGVEQGGVSLGGDGTITGYSVDTSKETKLSFTVTDGAGYSATAEMTITPTVKNATNDTAPIVDSADNSSSANN